MNFRLKKELKRLLFFLPRKICKGYNEDQIKAFNHAGSIPAGLQKKMTIEPKQKAWFYSYKSKLLRKQLPLSVSVSNPIFFFFLAKFASLLMKGRYVQMALLYVMAVIGGLLWLVEDHIEK